MDADLNLMRNLMKLSRRVTHAASGRLPVPVAAGLRRVVRGWGTLTARYRMVPEVVIVGAQRSGTTSLFRLLSDHPQVLRPTVSKGTAYFDLNYHRGFAWYRGHFPLKASAFIRGLGRRVVTFESCGYYMFHPLAAERIAADLPGARVVVMLRDPVERAHSAHKHELRRGFESEPFERAVALEESRLRGEVERLQADPAYQSYEYQHHAYLRRGEYAAQVARLVEAVGADRVFVMEAEQVFRNPEAEFGHLCEWLGLRALVAPSDIKAWNAAPRQAMSDELRSRLQAYFAPHNEELLRILAGVPSWPSRDVIFQERGSNGA